MPSGQIYSICYTKLISRILVVDWFVVYWSSLCHYIALDAILPHNLAKALVLARASLGTTLIMMLGKWESRFSSGWQTKRKALIPLCVIKGLPLKHGPGGCSVSNGRTLISKAGVPQWGVHTVSSQQMSYRTFYVHMNDNSPGAKTFFSSAFLVNEFYSEVRVLFAIVLTCEG